MKFGSVLNPQVKQTLEMCDFEVYVAYKLLATHIDGDTDPTHNPDWRKARHKEEVAWMQEAIHVVMSLKEEREPKKKDSAELSKEEIAYLEKVFSLCHGDNEYMKGWSASKDARNSLKKKRMVKVERYRACGMGDVDNTTCKITTKGHDFIVNVLRKR